MSDVAWFALAFGLFGLAAYGFAYSRAFVRKMRGEE